jgi:hypothetical protein
MILRGCLCAQRDAATELVLLQEQSVHYLRGQSSSWQAASACLFTGAFFGATLVTVTGFFGFAFARFAEAHRLRWASAIFARPSAEMTRFFEAAFAGAAFFGDPGGRPLRLLVTVPLRTARTSCNRAISASIVATISSVFTDGLYQNVEMGGHRFDT